jgi:hypothetical protein
MSHVLARGATRANSRQLSFVAAMAIALVGVFSGGMPAAANHQVVNCAVGGNLADGGTASVGCSMGGAYGTSLAGTIDASDPAMTVAVGYGGGEGYPAVNAAASIDVSESEVVLAGGVGGDFPYPAANVAGSYP